MTVPAGPADSELGDLRDAVATALPAYLADLERLVNVDCGSYTKAGVDEVGRWTGDYLAGLGAHVEYRPDATFGDTIVATFEGRPGGPRVLLIGHLDTVFDPGTVAERPFAIADGIATGPGVADMKGGLLAGLYGLRLLVERAGGAARLPFERLVFIANPDEEIGSPTSTVHVVEQAADADVCFVLESARANGDIVSSRKGIMSLRLTVHGRAAHAGVEPEKGRSAVLEAARLVGDLHALNGRWPDVTINAGVIAGGTRPNVVPARCTIELDVRAASREHLEAAEAAVRAAAVPVAVADTSIDVDVVHRWWPMEKLERSGRLVDVAQAVAGRLGFALDDTATGGASDANTTAGMGVPTLDGLGPIGGNDHSPAEYLVVDSIVPRTTLLAGLLLAVADDRAVASWRDTGR